MRRFSSFALVIVLFACGGDDTSQTTAAPRTTSETAPLGGDSSTTTTMTASESPIAQDVGLAPMVLLTPTEGVGERPDFAWEPVDGASAYKITVLAPDGSFYWGWLGPETSVPLGGFPRLIDGATGPRVVTGMTWTVVALDADLIPLAVGGPQTLSR